MKKRFEAISEKLGKSVDTFVMVLLILQPLLDIASYWTTRLEITTITTLLRFAMLAVVCVYCFLLSDRKRAYWIAAGVIGAYWILHMAACFHAGYQDIVEDVGYFLRTIHLPVLTVCFITCFKKGKAVPEKIGRAFLINMGIMMLSVGLSYLTGTYHYTYDHYTTGLVGWVAVDNCQSAIVSLILPLMIWYTWKHCHKAVFAAAVVLGAAEMYFIGTRLAYTSIPLILAGMLIALLLNGEKRKYYYAVLALVLLIAVGTYKLAPTYQVRQYSGANTTQRQEWADISVSRSKAALEEKMGEKLDEQDAEQNKALKVLILKDLYELYKPNFIQRFGLTKTVEAYHYSASAADMINLRLTKNTFAKLIWEESDFFTHLFGFEYSNMVYNDFVYDLENDFNAILYYYGYVGFAMYLAFFLYFLLLILKAILEDFRGTLTVEAFAVGITFVFLIGAAQLSGSVLRRPNVSIFLSLFMAYAYWLTAVQKGTRLFSPWRVKLFSHEK